MVDLAYPNLDILKRHKKIRTLIFLKRNSDVEFSNYNAQIIGSNKPEKLQQKMRLQFGKWKNTQRPGVTALDPEKISRNRKFSIKQKKCKIQFKVEIQLNLKLN